MSPSVALTAHPDAEPFARQIAANFREVVANYRKYLKLPLDQAVAKADAPSTLDQAERLMNGPPDEVSWDDLHMLNNRDPDQAAACWERLKGIAQEELQNGYRAALTLESGRSSPWQRAQFLAIRQDLIDAWQPRNGLERQLIDTLAQAQTGWLYWMDRLTFLTTQESGPKKRLEEAGFWEAPRVSDAEALEQAAAMAERFSRSALRLVRGLRDLRRYVPPVIVQHARQVNVAGQQVNVGG